MSGEFLTVRQVRARPVVAPLKRPVRTAVGTIPAAPLVLIDVATEEGTTGRSYLSGYNAPAALGPLARPVEAIGAELTGEAVVSVELGQTHEISRLKETSRSGQRRTEDTLRVGGVGASRGPQ